jgi:hypothetical protein
MAVRKVVTARHQLAAQLLVDGEPAYRALKAAGYSHWTARRFGNTLRHSWGLREAIRLELERRQRRMQPAPKRRRHDRRRVALAVNDCCLPEDRTAISNIPTLKLYAEEKRAERIAKGLPAKPQQVVDRFSDNLIHCPSCGKLVARNKLYLNMSQTGYACARCVGA